MATKICTKCKKEKDTSEFNHNKQKKDGYRCTCRQCDHDDGTVYRIANADKIRIRHKEYNAINKEKRQQYVWDHPEQTKAIKKKYIDNHPEERKEQCKRYYENNKVQIKERAKLSKDVNNAKRRAYNATHPQARIAHNQRTRIGAFLSGHSKGGRLHLLLGCDINFFIKYLESNFQDGMTWDNYGSGMDKWNVDHTIPLKYFNLENEDELRQAFHWSNCKPMWCPENASKGALYNGTRKHKK